MTVAADARLVQMSGKDFRRRLRWLVFHAWNIPPVFGLGFILLIGVLRPAQMIGILTTPLQPAYILGWLAFATWFLPRQMRPVSDWLDGKPGCSPESAQQAVRRFPLVFWATFVIYLAVAPASVILSAEIYTDFVATPTDWFRIQLVALIVSIIVGLPIFFRIFDLFGEALGAMRLSRPVVTIRTRVFLIGALAPLLIDTMLVQYYWTRTGYFTFETFGVWLLLEVLAIGGSLIVAHSIAQSLQPLQTLIAADRPLPAGSIAALRGRSTDELGMLTADYRNLLEDQRLQSEALERSSGLLRIAATAFESQQGMMVTNANGVILRVNRAFAEMTGYPAEEAVGQTPRLLRSGRHDEDFYAQVWESIRRTRGWKGEIWNRRKNGEVFPCAVTITAVESDDGIVTNYVGTHTDISEQKRIEGMLRISETRYRNFIRELPLGIVITQDGLIKYVNQALMDMIDYSEQDLLEKPFLPMVDEADRPRLMDLHLRRMRGEEVESSYVIGMVRKDGTVRQWQGYVNTIDWEGRPSGLGSFVDITDRKAAEEEIANLAFYDPLTQLPNRRLLMDRLRHAVASSARSGHHGALLFLDLDNFKTLNDTLGHDQGDLLLQQVAQRLVTCVREGDTVARLGGDEFVVLLDGLSVNPEEAAKQTENAGEKILATLNQPYQLAAYESHSSSSIGVTLFGGHENSTEELLKQADLAMYQAKAAGRNTLRFFDPRMQAMVNERAALEDELRAAVRQQQFVLHYQLQAVGAGHVTGVEALVRWQHPSRGMVAPGEFISLAEDTGLILPLGLWVLETACTQLARWADHPGTAHLKLAVNISAKQFQQADFVEQVLGVLSRSGADPKRLNLELTESLLVVNVENTIEKMNALKAQGVGFSLDDFGTGYSSLAYLKRLPLDQIKIDRGFVRDILIDPNDAAIARMIIALAASMELTVIAEGVESEAQRDALASMGCHGYQGYLFSRPLPLAEFEAFVSK